MATTAAEGPGISIPLFSDLYKAIRMFASDLASATEIPQKKRNKALQAFSETYRILDTGILIVVGRLGKVLEVGRLAGREAFATELTGLSSPEAWWQIERELRLCSTMRDYQQEVNRRMPGLATKYSVKSWDGVERHISRVLNDEGVLATHINETLSSLTSLGGRAATSKADFKRAQRAVEDARDELLSRRQAFISDEVALRQAIGG